MDLLLKVVEKIMVNALLSALLIFFSFSFMTGKFPPQKEDFHKAMVLGKDLFSSTREYNQQTSSLKGQNPNLEQMIMLQRLGLKRSEVALQLTQMMERLPKAGPSPKVAEQLQKVSESLAQVDQTLAQLSVDLQKMGDEK